MGKLDSFVKFSSFQYLTQVLTIISAVIYSFVAANYLGPEKYGLIYYLMGFLAGLPLVFGFEMFYDTLKVYLARYRSGAFLKKMLLPAAGLLLLLTIVSIFFSENVVSFAGKGTKDLIIMFSVLIFFVPLYSLLESVLIGFKQFGKILLLVVIEKITELALLLFFLFILRLDYLSLFYSTLISTILTVIFAVFFIKKIIFSKEIVPGKEVKKFAFQSWITNVSKGFMSQSEIWVFGLLLSLSGFGILYLVKKLTIYLFEAPQIAVSEVVLPFLSEEKDPQKIVLYASKVIKFQLLFGLFIGAVSVLLVPIFLPILFPKFLPGAGIFSVLVLGHVFYFGIPLSRLFKATNNNNALTLSFLVYMALILIMGFLLTPEFGLMGAAITLSSARIISGLFLYLMSLYKGYKVSVIPTLSDFIFFRQSSETLLKLAFAKTKRFFNPKKSC